MALISDSQVSSDKMQRAAEFQYANIIPRDINYSMSAKCSGLLHMQFNSPAEGAYVIPPF